MAREAFDIQEKEANNLALYTIADLHLSLGTDKPMDIFRGWQDYQQRIENNWRRLVDDDDTVVVAGDVSWAMKLANTEADFAFLDSLPGRKLIIKGNHDYWWETKSKMDKFIEEKGFSTLKILFNNSFQYGDIAICGTRGWSYDCPQSEQKVLLREVGRLKMSLDSAPQDRERVVFLHYPPVYSDYRCGEIMEVLHEYGIKRCYYGHLHGASHTRAVVGDCEGIMMKMVSGDACDFTPMLVER